MKHSGKALRAAFRIIVWTLLAVLALVGMGYLALLIGKALTAVAWIICSVWVLFALFTLYFFRDPNPNVPGAPGLVVAPGHGKVDMIDRVVEPRFMGGECQRISIFLSVFDVHVQNAPVGGRVEFFQYTPGKFLNALKTESAAHNENILLGFSAADRAGAKVGVRLITGLIARRLVPWVKEGDEVARGERISLIQFGSRVDVYLPLDARVKVMLGARVKGGETVLAELA
ncbi:MAG: phosphatidylserine decarboxylase [Limisphaerales bacterium]